MTGFHTHDNWFWERTENGGVQVKKTDERGDTIIGNKMDAAEWISVLTSVAKPADTIATHEAAKALHGEPSDDNPMTAMEKRADNFLTMTPEHRSDDPEWQMVTFAQQEIERDRKERTED